MKERLGFVSNSSSSSFLIPGNVDLHVGVKTLHLPEEIWKRIEKYHLDLDGNHIHLSETSGEWMLTEMISDCDNDYGKASEAPGAVHYLEGDSVPYGAYDDDADKNYIKFKKDCAEFYILAADIIGESEDDIPESIVLREKAKEIFDMKHLSAKQKNQLLEHIFNF